LTLSDIPPENEIWLTIEVKFILKLITINVVLYNHAQSVPHINKYLLFESHVFCYLVRLNFVYEGTLFMVSIARS
jgi:hypothetical protein